MNNSIDRVTQAEQKAEQDIANARKGAEEKIRQATLKAQKDLDEIEEKLSREIESIELTEQKRQKAKLHAIEEAGKAEMKKLDKISDKQIDRAVDHVVKALKG